MNLITDPWLPIRRESGLIEHIRPAQIAETIDPVVEVCSTRADLDAGGLLFLIGLVTTACAPETPAEWRSWSPPSVEDLDEMFSRYAYAFNMDGSGPRFMQDLTLFEELTPEQREKYSTPIAYKMVGGPSANSVRQNRAIMSRPEAVKRVSLSTMALSLCTHWAAPPYGGGFRGTARGSCPVSVVLLSKSRRLWDTVWLNVVSEAHLKGNGDFDNEELLFPWLTKVKGGKTARSLTQEALHPAHVFWPMARRIRLEFSGPGVCDITGRPADVTVEEVCEIKGGANYTSLWAHPLTPLMEKKETKDTPSSMYNMQARNGKGGGVTRLGWPHWPSVMGPGAPQVLRNARNSHTDLYDHRALVFGYIADQSKVVDFVYTEMADVRDEAGRELAPVLVDASRRSKSILISALSQCSGNSSKGGAMWSQVGDAFFDETEQMFYTALSDIAGKCPEDILRAFWKGLFSSAVRSFDNVADSLSDSNLEKVSKARQMMQGKLKTFVRDKVLDVKKETK